MAGHPLPPRGIRRYFRDSINHGTVAKFIVQPKSWTARGKSRENVGENVESPSPL